MDLDQDAFQALLGSANGAEFMYASGVGMILIRRSGSGRRRSRLGIIADYRSSTLRTRERGGNGGQP